ncbi:MAG: DUF421 domain-containing protein [Chloroflexi bacterium]|nr:DUF421 domain-containing protein [Chloroflexota bacterium]
MDSILRSIAVYFFLLLIFRISGKRSLAQITTFDFVLLLIIGEATQQALLGNDFSITNAYLVILTLIGVDIAMSLLKGHFPKLDKLVDSVPILLVNDGKLLKDRLDHARVDEDDILSKARELQGLERIDQIKYAILERSGVITIIPKEQS